MGAGRPDGTFALKRFGDGSRPHCRRPARRTFGGANAALPDRVFRNTDMRICDMDAEPRNVVQAVFNVDARLHLTPDQYKQDADLLGKSSAGKLGL
jgi:hypothetical protein